MKLAIAAEALRDLLADNLAHKGTLHVLEHVLLEAADGVLRATTTDLAQELTRNGAAEVAEPGRVGAHAGLLKSALTGLSGVVTLAVVKSRLVVSQPGRRFSVSCMLGDMEYPRMQHDKHRPCAIDTRALATALDQVSYAVADGRDPRQQLAGVFLDGAHAAATDGHRLAVAPVAASQLGEHGIIIPRDSLPLLRACLNDAATFSLSDSGSLVLQHERCTLITRLFDGRFPDWARVTAPADKDLDAVEFDSTAAAAAIKRMMAFAEQPSQRAAVRFYSPLRVRINGAIELSVGGDNESDESLECTGAAAPVEVGLNAKYLGDVMARANGAKCRWLLSGADVVQRFYFDGRADHHYVMPCRL